MAGQAIVRGKPMSKVTTWKCDECDQEFEENDGGIHIRELKQEPSGRNSGIIDGPFDFCKKQCLVNFFAKYQFRL